MISKAMLRLLALREKTQPPHSFQWDYSVDTMRVPMQGAQQCVVAVGGQTCQVSFYQSEK